MNERWVILILRDDDITRYYTGLRDVNDLRIYADTASDPRVLRYVAKDCAMSDLRGLMHDDVRAWADRETDAVRRERARAGRRAA